MDEMAKAPALTPATVVAAQQLVSWGLSWFARVGYGPLGHYGLGRSPVVGPDALIEHQRVGG